MTEEETVILALLLGKYMDEHPECEDETVEALTIDLSAQLNKDDYVSEGVPEDVIVGALGL
jgi:hypothetical protein